MNTFLLLPRSDLRYLPPSSREDMSIALSSSGAKPRIVAAPREVASNVPAYDVDDESGDIDMRSIPLLVPMLAGLMASVFFLVGWLGLALPLAHG
jgi:hypothetical protein